MAKDVDAQRAKLSRGEQLDAGFCYDPGRNPDIFECDEEDQRVAAGEVSRSWDGTSLTDLKAGTTETRDMPEAFRLATPVTLQEVAAASGGTVESAGADTTTSGSTTGTSGGTGNGRTKTR